STAGLTAEEMNQVDQTQPFGTDDTITFAPALAGQTITLAQAGDTTFGPSAFGIAGGTSVTIRGLTGDQGITLAGGGSSSNLRALYVAAGGSLTVEYLTLANFRAQGGDGAGGGWSGDSSGSGGGAGGGGAGMGGALFNEGTLALVGCTLTGNTVQGGAGGPNTLAGVTGAGGGPGSAGGFGGGGSG